MTALIISAWAVGILLLIAVAVYRGRSTKVSKSTSAEPKFSEAPDADLMSTAARIDALASAKRDRLDHIRASLNSNQRKVDELSRQMQSLMGNSEYTGPIPEPEMFDEHDHDLQRRISNLELDVRLLQDDLELRGEIERRLLELEVIVARRDKRGVS